MNQALAEKSGRRNRLALIAAGLFVYLAPGVAAEQSPLSQTEVTREAYAASIDIWSVLQESLPGQIRRLSPADAELRIQAAEKARLTINRTRQAYLNALRDSYTAVVKSLAGPAAARPAELDLLLAADKELLADIASATAFLDGEIRTIASTDRARAAALQKEKTDLLELRTIVLRRGRELDRVETIRRLAAGRGESLSKAYQRLADWTATAESEAAKEDAMWAAVYAKMRRELANLPLGTITSRKSEPGEAVKVEAPQPAPQAAPAVVQSAGGALVPSVGGVWILNNPRAKKLPNGAYEPASARLEVSQSGADIQGSFECTFAVPAEEKFNPIVRFSFVGKITNPILRFEISAPLSGSILLRQADGGLEVSYGISNPQRTGIAFGVVPEDGPMVLRRAIR